MPRKKKENLFPGYIRFREPNQEALGHLTQKAIGKNRTLTEFAVACGLSPSTISRITNAKFINPVSDSIIEAIAENADPESGVTLNDLLAAHGLAKIELSSSTPPNESSQVDPAYSSTQSKATNHPVLFISDPHMPDSDYYRYLGIIGNASSGKTVTICALLLSQISSELMLNSLFQRGFSIELNKNCDFLNLLKSYNYSAFALHTNAVAEDDLEDWVFSVHDAINHPLEEQLAYILGITYLSHPCTNKTKVSILTSDIIEYNKIKFKYSKIPISDCISIILVDFDCKTVLEEFIFHREGWPDHPSIFDVHT